MSVIKNDQLFSQQSLLSSHSGNLLQVREDGLYYGITQEPKYETLYVDAVNGNDSNPGTEALPLRTYATALSKPRLPGNRHIYLRAGQDNHFYTNGDKALGVAGGGVTVASYGPEIVRYDGWWVGEKQNYDRGARLHFHPGCVLDDHSGKKNIYHPMLSMANRDPLSFAFYTLQLHIHEHAQAGQLARTTAPLYQQVIHQGIFQTYHGEKTDVSVKNCSIHFHVSQASLNLGYRLRFIDGETDFHEPESHVFSDIWAIEGEGELFKKVSNKVFLDVRGISKPLFQKYFNAVQIDKYGVTNCNLGFEVRSLVKGY